MLEIWGDRIFTSNQTLIPDLVIIVDNNSSDSIYLNCINDFFNLNIQLIKLDDNLGFAEGNNIGYNTLKNKCEFILFLNPDAFLEKNYIKHTITYLQSNPNVGCVTGQLKRYDIITNKSTNIIDTVGINKTLYGRWYDIGQGENDIGQYHLINCKLKAICGAAMMCRNDALQKIQLHYKMVFDKSFFMYKEDIDLSRKLVKENFLLCYIPWCKAFHCRGWIKRSLIPKNLRLISVLNDLKVASRHYKTALPYALLKFLYVKYIE